MESTEKLLSILLIEKQLSADMRLRVEAHALVMIQNLATDAGNFLHQALDADQHTEDEVKTLINVLPSALSQLRDYEIEDDGNVEPIDREEWLPIQGAAWQLDGRNSMAFIALLAEEGEKFGVGGEGQRGGLLLKDYPNGGNVLQNLAKAFSIDNATSLDALKRLRQNDLLTKEDIRQYNLLWWSCKPKAKETFEYLVDWDPEALKEYKFEGNRFLHAFIGGLWPIDSFAMVFKFGMKYYPEELGFLFRKNSDGDTACKLVFDEYGKEKAWGVIEKCFDETRDVNKMIKMNPMTNLYPFILAAGDKTGDVNTLYYLLRRNPEVLFHGGQAGSLDSGDVGRTKRRRVS